MQEFCEGSVWRFLTRQSFLGLEVSNSQSTRGIALIMVLLLNVLLTLIILATLRLVEYTQRDAQGRQQSFQQRLDQESLVHAVRNAIADTTGNIYLEALEIPGVILSLCLHHNGELHRNCDAPLSTANFYALDNQGIAVMDQFSDGSYGYWFVLEQATMQTQLLANPASLHILIMQRERF